MSAEGDVLITRRLLRRAALRAVFLSIGLVGSTLLLILPEGGYASADLLLLHGALTGLVALPLTFLEAAAARRRGGTPLQVAAAFTIGLTALLGSSLAWSQARYTDEVLMKSGSIEAGLAATQGGGPITRRPIVATTIFVAPAVGLALVAFLSLRGASVAERVGAAPVAGVLLAAGFVATTGRFVEHLHLLAFAGAVAGVAAFAGEMGDALDERLSRETP